MSPELQDDEKSLKSVGKIWSFNYSRVTLWHYSCTKIWKVLEWFYLYKKCLKTPIFACCLLFICKCRPISVDCWGLAFHNDQRSVLIIHSIQYYIQHRAYILIWKIVDNISGGCSKREDIFSWYCMFYIIYCVLYI